MFVRNNRVLESMWRKEITLKVDNHYFFGKVIRHAGRYVIYIPRSEDVEYLVKKGKFSFKLVEYAF